MRLAEARVGRDCAGRRVDALHATQELGDEEVPGRVVCEGSGLLELRDGPDRPTRIDVPDPALVVNDPEASARVDGHLHRKADGGRDRPPAVARPTGAPVAGDEAEAISRQPKDTVREVGDEQ